MGLTLVIDLMLIRLQQFPQPIPPLRFFFLVPTTQLLYRVGSLVGTQFALRKHITLAQVKTSFSPALVAANNPSFADQIQFLNATGDGFVSYFLRGNGEWREVGTTVDVSNTTIIPPGVGIFVTKINAPTTLTFVGNVRTNNFALPLTTTLTFSALPYPVSFSPVSLGAVAATSTGWFGSNNPSFADQLQVLNSTGDGFVSYFLRLNGTDWREVGTLDNVQTSSLFAYDRGFFIARKAANPDFTIVSPVSL